MAAGTFEGKRPLRVKGATPRAGADTLPILVLAVLAAGVPMLVYQPLREQMVLPRLAASISLVGLALLLTLLPSRRPMRLADVRLPLGAALLLVLINAIATAIGSDPVGGLLGEYENYRGLLPLVAYVCLMFVAYVAVVRIASPDLLLGGIALGGTLSAGYGVLQRLGLDWVQWSGVDAGRSGGAFAQPDALGVEIVTSLFAAIALWSVWNGWRRDLVAVAVAVMIAGLVFTLSRGAWVGAVAGAGVLTVGVGVPSGGLRRALPLTLVPVALAALVGLSTGGGAVTGTLSRARSSLDLRETSVSTRLGLWQTAIDMWRDQPLLGSGADTFSTRFAEHRTADQPGIGTANVRPESSHNFFLDQLVSTGVLGLGVFIALVAATLWLGVRFARRCDVRERVPIVATIAGVIAYYASVFFSFSEAMTGWLPWLLLGIVLGVAAPANDGLASTPQWTSSLRGVGAGALGAVLLTVGCVLFIADLYAGHAATLAARGQDLSAADDARLASTLNPLQKQYLVDLGNYEQQTGRAGGDEALARAQNAFHEANRRFAREASTVLAEGEAMIHISDRNDGAVTALLEEATRLDPYNRDLRMEVASAYFELGDTERAAYHRDVALSLPAPP